jgi:hypothetical protein
VLALAVGSAVAVLGAAVPASAGTYGHAGGGGGFGGGGGGAGSWGYASSLQNPHVSRGTAGGGNGLFVVTWVTGQPG